MDWILRRAEPADAPALAACIDAAYAAHAARIPDLPAVSEGIAEDIATHFVWVAEGDDRIIGGIVLVPATEHAVLANVAVDPAATGLGLGRALISLAEAQAADLGFATLRLTTHAAIPENIRLYRHLGWHEAARSGNKVTMEKRLGPI